MRIRSLRRSLIVTVTVAATVLLPAVPAGAVPGVPDTTFSSDGTQSWSFTTGSELAMDMAIKGSKPVVVGVANGNITAFRLRAGGGFDTTFAGTGRTQYDLGGDEWGDAVAMQGSKILIGGSSGDQGAVIRLNDTGFPDPTFAGDGRLLFSVDGLTNLFVGGIADGLDGRVVAIGWGTDAFGDYRGFVARFANDGTFDASFSGDGTTVFAADTLGVDAVVLGSGKVLALLRGWDSYGDTAGAVWRLGTNGKPDTTYGGGDGAASFPASWDERSITRDGGKAVVVGMSNLGSDVGFVARFTTAGLPDTTFAGTGTVVTVFAELGNATMTDVAVQSNDAIVVAGETVSGHHLLMRYTATGNLDSTFNAPLGYVLFGGPGTDRTEAVKIDSNGRILVAGSLALEGDNNRDQVVYRYRSV